METQVTTENPGSTSKPRTSWLKDVMVPLLGVVLGGGGLTALVMAWKEPAKQQPTVSVGSGQVVTANNNKGPVLISGQGSTVNVAPEAPPQNFNHKITLQQFESATVQGVMIRSRWIGDWVGKGPYVDLTITDQGAQVHSGKVFAGEEIRVRNTPPESFVIQVASVRQHPKDPKMSWKELTQLGPAAEALLVREAELIVSGVAMASPTEPIIPPKREDLDFDYTIRVMGIGPIDVRKMNQMDWPVYFNNAAVNGNIHELEVFVRAGVDVNYQDPNGNTALFYAVFEDKLEAFKWLLRNGADPNIKNQKGNSVVDFLNYSPGKVQFSEALRKATISKDSDDVSP
jgi:hypothetical protein